MPSQTPSPGPTPSPRFKLATDYKLEIRNSPGLTTDILTFPSGSKLIINFPSFVAVGDTFSGTVQTETAQGKDEQQRARNQAELEKSVLLLGGQPVRTAERVFTRAIPQQINADEWFIVLKVNGKDVVNAQLPISQTPAPPPANTQLPTCGQMGKNVVVMDHCDGVIAPNDSCSIGGTPLPPLAESPRMRVLQNTSTTPGATQINYREQEKEASGPFQNFGVALSAGNLNLLRGQQTTLVVIVTGLTGIQQDVPLDLINESPAVINMEGGNAQHFDIHQADVAADGTFKIQRGLTGIQPGAFQIMATVVCPPEKPQPPVGGPPTAGPTPPGGPPLRTSEGDHCVVVGSSFGGPSTKKTGPGIKHVDVMPPKDAKDLIKIPPDDPTEISWKTSSKDNDPVPLVVSAWDIDVRGFTCFCLGKDKDGREYEKCKSTKGFAVVDVLNYVWGEAAEKEKIAPFVGVPKVPPGKKGKFLFPYTLEVKGETYYGGIVGPAALYQPPDLAVGEKPFEATLILEIADYPFGNGDDPVSKVTFKIEVVRDKVDHYTQKVFATKLKSIMPEKEAPHLLGKEVTVPAGPPCGCECQEPKWEPGGIGEGGTQDEVRACPGQPVVLRSRGHGVHNLTLGCHGNCGHSEEKVTAVDDTIYTWSVKSAKDGSFNGALSTDTNGWNSSVIYTAPTKPGEYIVTLNRKDSGKQDAVTNDPMKPKDIKVKVYKLDLQVGKQSGKSGVYLTKEEVEKDGGYVALNADDDNENGVIDLKEDGPGPVENEDDLIPIKLNVEGPEPKDVTLKVTSGVGKIRVWETKDRTKEVKSDAKLAGREVSLDAYGHVFKSAEIPKEGKELWVEGVKQSEKMQDVELSLELYVGSTPCPEEVKLTVVHTGLRADLDIDKDQDIVEKDDPLKAKPGAYVIVNNDDDNRDGTVDTANLTVARNPLDAASENEKDLKQVNVLTLFPALLHDKGKVVLSRSNGRVRVYSDHEGDVPNTRRVIKDVGDRLLWSEDAADQSKDHPTGYLKDTEGNGRKTWDLSDADQRAKFEAIVTNGLWVEGLEPSAALRDTKLTISYTPPDRETIECDWMKITVVRFSGIQATIEATPPNTPRLGNAPAPPGTLDHKFDNYDSASGIVRYLHENPPVVEPDGKKNNNNDFERGRALVLVRRSLDPVPLEVTREPQNVPVRWTVQRSSDDAPELSTNVPEFNSAPPIGRNIEIGTDEAGSFLVSCYVDVNGNGKFNEGEPRIILPLVLILVQGFDNTSVAQQWNASFNPAMPTAATGVRIRTTTRAIPFPVTGVTEGIINRAMVDVIGGGRDGRRGLDELFAGWVNNELSVAGSPTVPATEDVVANYRDPAPPNAVHSRISTWLNPASHVFQEVFTPANPLPAGAVFEGGPVLDTTNFGGEGIGGNTAVGTEGPTAPGPPIAVRRNRRLNPDTGADIAGEHWQVEMWDSPSDTCPAAIAGFLGARLTDYRFNLDFRSDLVFWTNIRSLPGCPVAPVPTPDPACRLYSTVQTNTWSIRFAVNFPALGAAVITTPPAINLIRDAHIDRLARPVAGSGLEVRAPISLRLLITDATR